MRCIYSVSFSKKQTIFSSFLAGTIEGIEEKIKKVPDVPETLESSWSSTGDRGLPKRCFERQGGSLSVKS